MSALAVLDRGGALVDDTPADSPADSPSDWTPPSWDDVVRIAVRGLPAVELPGTPG